MPDLDKHTTDAGRQAKLNIRVDGGQGRVYCSVGVQYHGDRTVSFAMFQDYSERVDSKQARATQKTIDTMFNDWTTDGAIALLQAKARAHYATAEA